MNFNVLLCVLIIVIVLTYSNIYSNL